MKFSKNQLNLRIKNIKKNKRKKIQVNNNQNKTKINNRVQTLMKSVLWLQKHALGEKCQKEMKNIFNL